MSHEVAEAVGIAVPDEPAQHGGGLAHDQSTVRQTAGHASENRTSPQWAKEADRIEQFNRRRDLSQMKDADIPRHEVIALQAERSYEPASFLLKTCTGDEHEQLRGMLGELREANSHHVREYSREVEAYLTLTGESMDLQERFRQWVHGYLGHRVSRPNPRDNGDPFRTFMRLRSEYMDALGNVGDLPGSIHYAFLTVPGHYAQWFLYDRILRDSFRVSSGRVFFCGERWDRHRVNHVAATLQMLGWEHDTLGHVFGVVKASVGAERLTQIGLDGPAALVEQLAEMATDIQQMRPFLLDGFHPENTAVPIGDGQFLVWQWFCRDGIGIVALSDTPYEWSKDRHRFDSTNIVRTDGVLINNYLPWRAATDLADPQALAVNQYILSAVWEKLYRCYEKVDLERIRRRASRAGACEPVDDMELALSCSDLAWAENVSGPAPSRRGRTDRRYILRPLRLPQVLRFLERHFACEVRQGKGSEKVAYRNGQRIFRFGCHGASPIVPMERLSAALTRLGITRREWCSAVYGEV